MASSRSDLERTPAGHLAADVGQVVTIDHR
jgi:hypothetical protein